MKREAWASLTTAISSFVCWPYTMPVSRHSCEEPQGYYKVPKFINGLLEEVGFNSNAGVMSFKNSSDGEPAMYIAFDDFNLYYNISTLELMARLQIEVVDTITK